MKSDLTENIKLQRVSLKTVKAVKNKVKADSYILKVQVEPSIAKESDSTILLLCKITVGDKKQPFTIEIVTETLIKKVSPINGELLIENFWQISYPILSEMSLMIAQVVSAMNYPPLILSPDELRNHTQLLDDEDETEG